MLCCCWGCFFVVWSLCRLYKHTVGEVWDGVFHMRDDWLWHHSLWSCMIEGLDITIMDKWHIYFFKLLVIYPFLPTWKWVESFAYICSGYTIMDKWHVYISVNRFQTFNELSTFCLHLNDLKALLIYVVVASANLRLWDH